jgi:hypothetical protein
VSSTVAPGLRVRTRRAVKAASRVVTRPSASLRALPDFLIIGAQRAGTTSLYRYLERHPAVMPAVLNKGVHFFDERFDRGITWYRSNFPAAPSKAIVRRRHAVERVVTGEASPYYAFHPLVPERVAGVLPDVRLILVLRDPVSRAYSHYQHEVARGFETLPFDEAIEREPERLAGEERRILQDGSYHSFEHQHHSYVARGMYLEQIRRWHARFPSERLLIVDADELFGDPAAAYAAVVRFLGLPPFGLERFERLNAHAYDDMSPAARARLREAFAGPNRELCAYLGRRFAWATP